MSFNEREPLELCECASEENELDRCNCVCEGSSGFDHLEHYRLTLDAILSAHQQMLDFRLVGATTCRIPSSCPTGFQGRYTVRSGDSMFSIAQRCGVTLQALINANPHIPNPNVLIPCDVLCVPPRCADVTQACRIPSSCPPGFQGRYTVRSGDSMFSIAQRCGVTLQALINANPHIPNPNVLFPCDVLCVPASCANRSESEDITTE